MFCICFAAFVFVWLYELLACSQKINMSVLLLQPCLDLAIISGNWFAFPFSMGKQKEKKEPTSNKLHYRAGVLEQKKKKFPFKAPNL